MADLLAVHRSLAPVASVRREQFNLAWGPATPAIATMPSGAVVQFDLLDSSCGQLGVDSTASDLQDHDFGRVDQINGPIAVAGAEPGDVVEIEFLEPTPADWGWTACIPGFGLVAGDFTEPAYRVTRIKPGLRRVEFLPGIWVPIAPFCGVVGVAPAVGPLSTIPPNLHGGHIDTRHLAQGSAVPARLSGRGIAERRGWTRGSG